MKPKNSLQDVKIESNLIKISFDKLFAPLTVSMPLGAMLLCFTTAVIFQFDEVNKTVCAVSRQ